MKKVLAISGSTRKGSTNEAILRKIKEKYADRLDVVLYNGIDSLPHFNPDLDKDTVPESVSTFRNLIDEADGALICTPEYVFSLPGSLKNALEWTVSTVVFSYKPVGLIVASANGQKALESLDIIMSTLIQYPVSEKAKLLIGGGRSKVSSTGTIEKEVMSEVESLVDFLIEEMEGKEEVN